MGVKDDTKAPLDCALASACAAAWVEGQVVGPASLVPLLGVSESRPASRLRAYLVVRRYSGPENAWGSAIPGAVSELPVVVADGMFRLAARTLCSH